jgi:hypothetical protein
MPHLSVIDFIPPRILNSGGAIEWSWRGRVLQQFIHEPVGVSRASQEEPFFRFACSQGTHQSEDWAQVLLKDDR